MHMFVCTVMLCMDAGITSASLTLMFAGPEPKPAGFEDEKQEEVAEKAEAAPPKVKEWFEAKSPEGYSYYWNVATNGR